ncbi:MAG: WCX domain-containing protein, partial [Mycobacteriaceae bacterium]
EVIELDIGSSDRLARDIAGYGADAVVFEPQPLREDVLARLRAHVDEAGAPPARGGERRS